MDWIELLPDRTGRFPPGVIATALSLALCACSVVGPRQSPLPQGGATLIQVYRDHLASEGKGSAVRERLPLRPVGIDTTVSLRGTNLPSMQQRFERLPNPDLVMHVYPHLARGKYPIPGYVTVFPMYETVEYAMPGEVAPRAAHASDLQTATNRALTLPAAMATARCRRSNKEDATCLPR